MSNRKHSKVTDLEEFCEKEIWMPYLPIHPEMSDENKTVGDYSKIAKRMSLDETVDHLVKHQNTDWVKRLANRIDKCDFWFPEYISHPIIPLLKELMKNS